MVLTLLLIFSLILTRRPLRRTSFLPREWRRMVQGRNLKYTEFPFEFSVSAFINMYSFSF